MYPCNGFSGAGSFPFQLRLLCTASDGAPQLAPTKAESKDKKTKLAADVESSADRAASPPDNSPPSPETNAPWPPPAFDANPIGVLPACHLLLARSDRVCNSHMRPSKQRKIISQLHAQPNDTSMVVRRLA